MTRDQATLTLAGGEAHVWMARTESLLPAVVDGHRAVLGDDERTRLDSIAREARRLEYLVTRSLVRRVLSLYEPVPPTAWRFGADPHGRPVILSPATVLPIDFNLSHGHGLVLCALALGRRVGVDVERADRVVDIDEIGADALAPSERADLAATAPSLRAPRFFEYWTLKESYLKARGTGLSIPLDGICFSLLANREPRLGVVGCEEDAGSSWSFHSFWPTAEHVAAATVERRFPGEEIKLVLRSLA